MSVTILATKFDLYEDGRIGGHRYGRNLPPSRILMLDVSEVGQGAMTISIITENWDYVKTTMGNPVLRKEVSRLRAWHLRCEARRQLQAPTSVPLPPPVIPAPAVEEPRSKMSLRRFKFLHKAV